MLNHMNLTNLGVVSAVLILGVAIAACSPKAPEERSEKPASTFTKEQRTDLIDAAQIAIEAYKEEGLAGLIVLVKDCYESGRSAGLECVAYDFMGWYIDSGMAKLNRFPRDDFFTDNKTLSRSAGSNYFADNDLALIFMTLMEARNEIIEHYQNLGNGTHGSCLAEHLDCSVTTSQNK